MKSVKHVFRHWAKAAFHSAGFEVRRLRPDASPSHQLCVALRRFGIDLVLDVGANVGQFGAELRAYGYSKPIVSFEPLSVAHAALTERAAGDPSWSVHPRTAVGDVAGTVEINVSANLFSSSLLPMLHLHEDAAPQGSYVGKETVRVARLDEIATAYLENAANPFLKIDTQGFERHVLEGAEGILPRVRGVLCELSLVPLYEGQALWLEMLSYLEALGFTLWALQPGFTDPRDGRTLQVDAIWFRE
jgi:FkbM family methyltransferase